jgi:hypothetical protein
VQSRVAAEPGREIVVRAHPDVAAHLEGDAREALERLRATLETKITIQAGTGATPRDEVEIVTR